MQKNSNAAAHCRFESLADILTSSRHVRFTPESRHSLVLVGCRLCLILELVRGKQALNASFAFTALDISRAEFFETARELLQFPLVRQRGGLVPSRSLAAKAWHGSLSIIERKSRMLLMLKVAIFIPQPRESAPASPTIEERSYEISRPVVGCSRPTRRSPHEYMG
jgi:hypothetical protein